MHDQVKQFIAEHPSLPDCCELIVVVGYDSVGKGTFIEQLAHALDIDIFYPDYNVISKYTPREGLWTYFMYFLDWMSKISGSYYFRKPVIVDRSSICGAVYHQDLQVAAQYAEYLKKINIMHILVTCSEEDFNKFKQVRGDKGDQTNYQEYKEITQRYQDYMDKFGLQYIEYQNRYDPEYGQLAKQTCAGCSFNKYGVCHHPANDLLEVNNYTPRCEHYRDKEIQDQ